MAYSLRIALLSTTKCFRMMRVAHLIKCSHTVTWAVMHLISFHRVLLFYHFCNSVYLIFCWKLCQVPATFWFPACDTELSGKVFVESHCLQVPCCYCLFPPVCTWQIELCCTCPQSDFGCTSMQKCASHGANLPEADLYPCDPHLYCLELRRFWMRGGPDLWSLRSKAPDGLSIGWCLLMAAFSLAKNDTPHGHTRYSLSPLGSFCWNSWNGKK